MSLLKMCGCAGILAVRGASNDRSAARLVSLFLLLCGTLSIFGCVGLTGGPDSSKTPAVGTISISPASVNFGSVAVGGTVYQSVTISNSSQSSISVTQASTMTSGFKITGAALPMTIGAGQQSTLNIVFSPKNRGAVAGTVSVMSSASSRPSTISISGTGVAAQALLNYSAPSLSFGNVSSGATSVLGVTLMNAGNSNVTISGVKVAGTRFTVHGVSAGMILAPGQNTTLDVAFSPSAAGTLRGSVTVVSNAANSPSVISLSGAGGLSAAHSVALAWMPDASAAAGYNVYRSTVSGGPYARVNSPNVAATAYTDSSVRGGQIYYYVITGVNFSGMESPLSTEVSAAIPTP